MNNAQRFLIDNGISDIVLNENKYSENTTENALKWIYLSDLLEQYANLIKEQPNSSIE